MKNVIYLLFVVLLVSISQATILKFEAEDATVYYVPGAAWDTVDYEGASGGKCITSTQEGTVYTEANARYYSFNMPAGTYNLYVRMNIDDNNLTTQGVGDNDSCYVSDNSLAEDAGTVDWNSAADDALDAANFPVVNNFGWAQVQQSWSDVVRTYVMAVDGTAYFKVAPREDGLYIDAFAFVSTDEGEVTNQILDEDPGIKNPTLPSEPVVLPDNGDGTVGDLQLNNEDVIVTLNFKAGGDPNSQREPAYPVNPDILGHYIYISNGSDTDPNVYLLDYVAHTHNVDPYLTDPNVWYGPMTLLQSATYSWQVEEGLDDGTGNPYGAGDPNNTFWGRVWSFTTISATPAIVVGPENVLADFSGNASFSVTASPATTDYRWFKVGTPDVELSDGGIYSGTQTSTLTITGATASDEGQFYCIAYNGDPGSGGTPSVPSDSAKLWYPRLTSHYPFEIIVDSNSTPDIVSGFDAALLQEPAAGLPVLNDTDPIVGAYSLQFDNPNSEGQYALADAGVADYADITISVWVYWNGGENWQRIVDFGNNTDEYIFLTPSANNGELRFAVKNVTEQSISTDTLPTGVWTHVTATLSGDTARLYVNGELVQTGQITHDPVNYSPALNNYIAKSQYPDPYFDGLIDDLKIYNYARTTEQIALDYLDVKGDWICNNELYDLPYDFDGDCEVDIDDLAAIVGEWLDSYRIYAP